MLDVEHKVIGMPVFAHVVRDVRNYQAIEKAYVAYKHRIVNGVLERRRGVAGLLISASLAKPTPVRDLANTVRDSAACRSRGTYIQSFLFLHWSFGLQSLARPWLPLGFGCASEGGMPRISGGIFS